MQAIQTYYNGYHFRSRLESRWAVYFDCMGFEYFYEHEGFDLDEAGYYLPDFYLPHVRMWAEVKPEPLNETELTKLKALVFFTKKPALMLVGLPDRKPYEAWCLDLYCKPSQVYKEEFILSNYHNYYRDEERFYGSPCDGEVYHENFIDVMDGILAAKSARF